MGNNFCSRCGAQIVGEGKFCSNCGAPVEVTVIDINNAPVPVKKRKGRIILISAIALLVVAAIAVGCVFVFRKSPVRLPYGISPDMPVAEGDRIMQEEGFKQTYSQENEVGMMYFYDTDEKVYGCVPAFTALSLEYHTDRMSVTYFYEGEDLEGLFKTVRDELLDEYGDPDNTNDEDYYDWRDGNYIIVFRYLEDGDMFCVDIDYVAE